MMDNGIFMLAEKFVFDVSASGFKTSICTNIFQNFNTSRSKTVGAELKFVRSDLTLSMHRTRL